MSVLVQRILVWWGGSHCCSLLIASNLNHNLHAVIIIRGKLCVHRLADETDAAEELVRLVHKNDDPVPLFW